MDLTTIDATHCPGLQIGDPVTLLGSPETLSAIDCVLLLTAVVPTVYEVELPAATDADAGDTPTVKSGGGGGVCEVMVT